jgi:hypothetical protein
MSPFLKLLVIVAIVASSGCGKKAEEYAAERALESATGVDVDIANGGESLTMESAYGPTTIVNGDSAKLPKDYPRDVYVPGDAAFSTSVVSTDGSMVVYNTGVAPPAVYAKVRSEMSAQGWKEDLATETPEASMLHYRKDDRTVQYMIQAENGATSVTQVYAVEKPESPTE